MLIAIVRVLIGFVLACLVAGLIQVGFAIGLEALLTPSEDRRTLEWVLLTATHSMVFSAPFALIAASIAEWQSLRSFFYHVLSAVCIAMAGFAAQYQSEIPGQPSIANNYAMVTYAVTGLLAGVTYWLFSGRFAGEEPERRPTEPRSGPLRQIDLTLD